jgi:hypothetical protein
MHHRARPHVVNRYRSEEINLQPYGNTISVETESDNPFEADQDVEVFTQASGGMAGPDPRQRSRGLLAKRNQTTHHQGGKVRTFKAHMDAAHPGFMPGMGELAKAPARRARPTVSRSFMPGMSGLGDAATGYDTGEGNINAAGVPVDTGTPSWLTALTTGLNAGAQTTSSVMASKTAAAQAKAAQSTAAAEQARADQMRQSAMITGGGAKSYATPLIGLAVAGAALFMFMKMGKRK